MEMFPLPVSTQHPISAKPSAAGEPVEPLDQGRAALREAAQGFEAIMVRRMLESARASSFVEETPLTGGGLNEFQAMRDEQLAEITSQTGTLGLARSIEAQLSQHLPGKADG